MGSRERREAAGLSNHLGLGDYAGRAAQEIREIPPQPVTTQNENSSPGKRKGRDEAVFSQGGVTPSPIP